MIAGRFLVVFWPWPPRARFSSPGLTISAVTWHSQYTGGCPGWLFLADEIMAARNDKANLARRLVIISQVAAFLERRHIELVVVPVPDKSRVETKALCLALRKRSKAVVEARTSISAPTMMDA